MSQASTCYVQVNVRLGFIAVLMANVLPLIKHLGLPASFQVSIRLMLPASWSYAIYAFTMTETV